MPYRDPKSPNWSISYTAANGKRVRESSGTADFKEAKALEAKKRLERHRVVRWGEKPKHTYDELMLTYLKDTSGQKKSHDRDVTSAAALQGHFAGSVVEEWDPAFISLYKSRRRFTITAHRRHVSEATIAKGRKQQLSWPRPRLRTAPSTWWTSSSSACPPACAGMRCCSWSGIVWTLASA